MRHGGASKCLTAGLYSGGAPLPPSLFCASHHTLLIQVTMRRGTDTSTTSLHFSPSPLSLRDDTAARGCGRPSLAEGRGLSFITVSGLRPRDARFSFFCARSGGGSKAFSLSGREGHCPVGIAPPLSREKQRQRKKTSAPRPAPEGAFREKSPPKVQ